MAPKKGKVAPPLSKPAESGGGKGRASYAKLDAEVSKFTQSAPSLKSVIVRVNDDCSTNEKLSREQDEAIKQSANVDNLCIPWSLGRGDGNRKRAALEEIGLDGKRPCYGHKLLRAMLELDVSLTEMKSVNYDQHAITGFYQGTQTVGGGPNSTLLTRKYKNNKCACVYYEFLKDNKHYNLLTPSYKMEDGNDVYFVFGDRIDCSLRGYLAGAAAAELLSAPDQSYQQALSDNVASVHRQILEVTKAFHDKKMSVGVLNLDNIYLDLSGKLPRVLLILPDYENQVETGNHFNILPYNVNVDLSSLGVLFNEAAVDVGLTLLNAAEFICFCTDLQQQRITSCSEALRHPAVIFESRKLIYLLDVYEHILKVYKDDFFGPKKFLTPRKLQEVSWRVYFAGVLKLLRKNIRKRYHKGPERDNFCNFCKFLRNIVIHLGSTASLLHEFGDGTRFLFYARSFYPALFSDLINVNIRYPEKQGIFDKLIYG